MNFRLFTISLIVASIVAIGLFAVGALRNHTFDYWYLPYNLFLGAIPLALAVGLRKLLNTYNWKNWRTVALLIIWLLFLPNSFYIFTDYIHLPEVQRVDIVQDVIMLAQFSIVGFVMGFASLWLLHTAYLRHLRAKIITPLVGVVLLLSSFAIYLGRELRWNSWDVVSNPVGLFGDVWSIVAHPSAHPGLISVTLSYFAVLVTLYWCMWIAKKNA
ncbi:MAG TPA: DUF1361 domain-containing protein [Candidatus Saccharimonadales bacterium]|nr:DUF1361 domain-containing protein [Candidatus Saccharimonadales bacterium]